MLNPILSVLVTDVTRQLLPLVQASGLELVEWRNFNFREGAGCIECGGTGYRGRSAIHELLELDDEIREMLLAKKPGSEIRKKEGHTVPRGNLCKEGSLRLCFEIRRLFQERKGYG